MKVRQELRIGPLGDAQEAEFISWVEAHLTTGWSRKAALEEKLREAAIAFYCFACEQSAARQAATLFLTRAEREATSWLYVSNIVPEQISELSLDQYNQILQDFWAAFAKPAADSIGVPVELSPDEQSVKDWLSPESARLLKLFSLAANKSTGSSHPMDRQRWYDFLIALHHSGENPSVNLLRRWLVEEERWSDEAAFDLVCEYEFALGLLDRFDRR